MSKPAGKAYDLIMKDTGLDYALSIIGGKYKMIILFCLFKFEVMRFNELKRMIDSISLQNIEFHFEAG